MGTAISIPTEPIGWFFIAIDILLLIIIASLPIFNADLSMGKFSDIGLRNKRLPKSLQWCHNEYSYRKQWFFKYALSGITYIMISLIATQSHNDERKLYFWASLITFSIHQFKRCIEVLCIHQYSHNTMHFGSGFLIIILYFVMGLTLSYGNVTNTLSAEQLNNDMIIYIGLAIWFIGEIGNGGCHIYLAWKRKSIEDNGYIPLRHLPLIFRVLITPNMVFELVLWSGYCIIMRELYSIIMLVTMVCYVCPRLYKTYDWYESHPDGTVNADFDEDDVIGRLDFDTHVPRKDTVSLHRSTASVQIIQ